MSIYMKRNYQIELIVQLLDTFDSTKALWKTVITSENVQAAGCKQSFENEIKLHEAWTIEPPDLLGHSNLFTF